MHTSPLLDQRVNYPFGVGRTSDTPEKLQRALSQLMWTQSYGSVTIDAVCNEAEVKKGSFYHFYSSKADLAVAALERSWMERSRPWMDTAFSSSIPPLKRVASWLDLMLTKTLEAQHLYGKVVGCPFFNAGSELSTLEPDVVAKVLDILTRYQCYIASALRDANESGHIELTDVSETARDVLTLAEGALTRARITNDPEPLRRLPISIGRLIGTPLPASRSLTN